VLAGEEHTEGQKERDIFHHTDTFLGHTDLTDLTDSFKRSRRTEGAARAV
jgi:hypothetical protein